MADETVKVKRAHYFRLMALQDGEKAYVDQIDWAQLMQNLLDADEDERERLAVGDLIFQPGLFEGRAVLGMHAPISTDFLSHYNPKTQEVTDVMSDDEKDDTPRFAHSTAIAFSDHGNIIGAALGANTSPRATSIRHFLERFQTLGQGAHWHVEPVMDPSRILEFMDSKGAVSFEAQFSTAKDLTTEEEGIYGPVSFAESMAKATDADLIIDLNVKLASGVGNAESRGKLKNLLSAALPILARAPKSRTKARVLTADGVYESLNLVASRMQQEFEIAATATERRRFSDLLEGVAVVTAQVEDRLKVLIEG